MADHDATQPLQPNDERAKILPALDAAHAALIGATAVLANWLSIDANDPHAFDFDSAADPADADFACAVEVLVGQAERQLGDAMEAGDRLWPADVAGEIGRVGEIGRALRDVWTMVGGVKQLVWSAGIADDQAALRPEAGAALVTVLARLRDELSERRRQLYEVELAAA